MTNNKKKLVTHDGGFHTDDIFACATISLILEKKGEEFEVLRSRDEEVIKSGDFVFDVGGIHDENTNRFDHHQKGGAGKRKIEDVEIEYAAFGLVWKKFGSELCGSQVVADVLDKKLVAAVDANDNGFSLIEKKYEVSPFLIQDLFSQMRSTWQESTKDQDKNFLKAVALAKEVLIRSIVYGKAKLEAEKLILEAYEKAEDKRIIALENYYPLGHAFDDKPEVLFVIFPRETNDAWVIKAVGEKDQDFKNRKDFPVAWAGLTDGELAKTSGVADAMFCHRGLFIAVAKSKEGAIKLAQIAVES